MNPLLIDPPVVVYPSIATAINFEAAGMLSILAAQALGSTQPTRIDRPRMQLIAPWWDDADVERLMRELAACNALSVTSPPYRQSGIVEYTITHATPANETKKPAAGGLQKPVGKTLIAENWEPQKSTVGRLIQMGVDEGFLSPLVAPFVAYWRDRNEAQNSWESKFHGHVIHKWRYAQSRAENDKNKTHIPVDFRPSQQCFDALNADGIDANTATDFVPAFVLDMREKNVASAQWNSDFRRYVIREHSRMKLEHEKQSKPTQISAEWQPSNAFWRALSVQSIDEGFARDLIAPFVMYWCDNGQAKSSWNAGFLNYVRREFEKQKTTGSAVASMGIERLVNDRSWAD